MTRDKPPAADACVKATPPAAMILDVEAFAGALPPNARLIGIDVRPMRTHFVMLRNGNLQEGFILGPEFSRRGTRRRFDPPAC